MLAMLRREWERARAASATAPANGAAQPENLSSVRRVAREVLAQVQLQIFLYLSQPAMWHTFSWLLILTTAKSLDGRHVSGCN